MMEKKHYDQDHLREGNSEKDFPEPLMSFRDGGVRSKREVFHPFSDSSKLGLQRILAVSQRHLKGGERSLWKGFIPKTTQIQREGQEAINGEMRLVRKGGCCNRHSQWGEGTRIARRKKKGGTAGGGCTKDRGYRC